MEAGVVRGKDLPEGKDGIGEKVLPSHQVQEAKERNQEGKDRRAGLEVIDMPECIIEKL